MDRTKEPGALGEPLYLDVAAAMPRQPSSPMSSCAAAAMVWAPRTPPPAASSPSIDNAESDKPVNGFTISIVDDVTNLTLPITEEPDIVPAGTTSCKFWGLGSDGTVGANKNSIKIIGDHTDLYVQAYFAVRLQEVRRHHHQPPALRPTGRSSPPTMSTRLTLWPATTPLTCPSTTWSRRTSSDGGTFLHQLPAWTVEELEPASARRRQAPHRRERRQRSTPSTPPRSPARSAWAAAPTPCMQAAFFKLANIIPIDDAVKYMKAAIEDLLRQAKGQNVVDMNKAAVDAGHRPLWSRWTSPLTGPTPRTAPSPPPASPTAPTFSPIGHRDAARRPPWKATSCPVSSVHARRGRHCARRHRRL